MSGIAAIRGFVVQALVALLQVCNKDCRQICFEPSNKADEKVDFWWEDGNGVKYAVQVKSTKNEFTDSQVESWANALQKNHEDMVCTLVLVGTYQQSKTPLQTKVYIEIEPFDENVERYELELWKKAERGIVDLLDKRKLAIGTPTGWNRAVKWGIGEFLTKCDKPMTPENFINNLKGIVIAGTDFQHAIDRYRQKTIDDLSKRKDSFSKKLLSEMFVEQDFYVKPLSSQASGEKSPPTNSFKMVEDHPRLFILSEPGMGKSTFLNALALRYAKDAEKLLPILIRLRENLPDMDTIADAIGINHTDRPEGKDFIRDMLQAGRALLILDGLDETKVEQIHNIKASIHNLNPSHCLITCRLSHGSEGTAFESEEDFKRVQMAKLSRGQIELFADNWFLNSSDANYFKNKIFSHNNLTELASQPLLLALLCSNFEKTKTFGQSRADIYKKAIETLLKEWDTGRDITRNSCFGTSGGIRKKQAILSAIAYENFKENRYTMTRVALEKQIEKQVAEQDGKDVLQEIAAHHGILIKQNNDNYTFLHLTFQEYFTALAISGNTDYQQELMQHIHDPRWREIFLLTASLLDNADDFFDYFQQGIFVRLRAVPEICELVAWAAKRVEQLGFEQNIAWILRPVYCSFVLDNMHSAIPDCAVDKDSPVTSHFVIALSNPDIHYLPRHIDILRKYSHQLATDYLLQRAYNTPLLQPTYDLHNFPLVSQEKPEEIRKFLQEMAELFLLCDEIELSGLMKRASELLQQPEEWQMLASKLRAKLAARLDLTFCVWFEDSEQLGKVLQYIQASHFCLDCLNLATVTNREAIRNSLFLPPEESASGG